MSMAMSKILNCNAVECVYNKGEQCHAFAITVGAAARPLGDTALLSAGKKGGVSEVVGGVGACRVETCKYNKSWECAAQGINVGIHTDHPDGTTFKAR